MTDSEKQKLFSDVDRLMAVYSEYEPINPDGTFDIEKIKKCLEDMAQAVIADQNERDAFIDFMKNRTDFFTAPASTRFHGDFEGGLAVHSLKFCSRHWFLQNPLWKSSLQYLFL